MVKAPLVSQLDKAIDAALPDDLPERVAIHASHERFERAGSGDSPDAAVRLRLHEPGAVTACERKDSGRSRRVMPEGAERSDNRAPRARFANREATDERVPRRLAADDAERSR